MITKFFLPIIPPTCTHQEKQVNWETRSFYDAIQVKAARAKFQAHIGKYVPKEKYTGPVRLLTKWCFPITGKHKDGEYKTSRPDTDNMIKLLKDVMTDLGFWRDDSQVASEITEKFWADVPGIYVHIEDL